MTDASVIAVGGPPTFRHQVARALERDVDGVDWTATVSAAESAMEDRHQPPNVVVLAPGVKEVDESSVPELVTQLKAKFANSKAVYVRADKDTPWEVVAQVFNELGQAKVDVRAVTQPEEITNGRQK